MIIHIVADTKTSKWKMFVKSSEIDMNRWREIFLVRCTLTWVLLLSTFSHTVMAKEDNNGRADAVLVSKDTIVVESKSTESQDLQSDVKGTVEKGFFKLSLEDLLAQNVFSVSGIDEEMFTSPAAITVITAEDIRRSGHRNLPEVLRMVPGLHVARLNSHTWAISSRGFSQVFSSKMLVLIDGRTVYTPFFSGVEWDVQNVPLENIERIEVIRGPGATIWGANAVNGVINVVTKEAKDTQGGLVTAGGGTFEEVFGMIRYGFELNDATWIRMYGQYFNRDQLPAVDDHDPATDDKEPHDEWNMFQGGFRLDQERDNGYSLTLQGDAYYSNHLGRFGSQPIPVTPFSMSGVDDMRVSGANLLFRLSRKVTDESEWSLQGYYDRVVRDDPFTIERDENTFDVEFRHHFPLGDRQGILWGAGYRLVTDSVQNTFLFRLNPNDRKASTFSAFLQDTVTLVEDRLILMVGSKFQHNDYTGFEIQPSIRLSWTLDDKQTIWSAVSRAVRVPSRIDSDWDLTIAFIPFPSVTPLRLLGNRDLDSEELIAYETGYRVRPLDNLSLDITAFYNDYDELIESIPSPTDPFAITIENAQHAESYGVEVSAKWDITNSWRVTGNYSFLRLQYHGPEDKRREDRDPKHQFNMLSQLNITDDLELNTGLYYVDSRHRLDVSSYIRADLGLTLRPTENLEFTIWGQNLLDSEHVEFINPSGSLEPGSIERSVYGMINWKLW